MKKFVILIASATFLFSSAAFAKQTPEKINGMFENDFILDEMLPNPNVYLYGKDSNGYPILLMNFSSTIPFFAIEDHYRLLPKIARYWPLFHKQVSHLKFFSLYLKIEPTCVCDNKGFTYKIIKLQCDEKSQTIKHSDTDEYKAHAEPEYSSSGNSYKIGYIEGNWTRQMDYGEDRPIIAYSGVGSDTLKIMLRKGKKYPIPSGHIDISMVVLAIPNYCADGTKRCKFAANNNEVTEDYINDFMSLNCKCGKRIRNIAFGKIYLDNRIKNYYEVSPYTNPHGVDLTSEVVKGSRINQTPVIATVTTVEKTPAEQCSSGDKSKATKTVISTTKGEVLDDRMFMYDEIFRKQIPNTYSPAYPGDVVSPVTAPTPAATPAAK